MRRIEGGERLNPQQGREDFYLTPLKEYFEKKP
jgi:hypothetical protein